MKTKMLLATNIMLMFSLFHHTVFESKPFKNFVSGEPKPIQTSMQHAQDTTEIHQYGEKIAGLLLKADWPAIVKEIHAINLPDGWEGMVKPSFEGYFGKELSVKVIPFETLPDYQLKWLYKAPEGVLAKTKYAIRLNYDISTEEGTDKGKLELAVYEEVDGKCSILVVGGGN